MVILLPPPLSSDGAKGAEPPANRSAGAHALFGVSPITHPSQIKNNSSWSLHHKNKNKNHPSQGSTPHGFCIIDRPQRPTVVAEAADVAHKEASSDTFPIPKIIPPRPPESKLTSGRRGGLDLLIALAEQEQRRMSHNNLKSRSGDESAVSTSASSSDEEDDEAEGESIAASLLMPPPPARRRRSNSSPATMRSIQHQHHILLPDSFLQHELAELSRLTPTIPEDRVWNDPDSNHIITDDDDNDGDLLSSARARLLQELSRSPNQVTFPHELPQYQNKYNCNGHIGVYDELERAALLTKFHEKRKIRNWSKKKVRYDCRKSLADRRVRVKGRFVKKEESALVSSSSLLLVQQQQNPALTTMMPDTTDPEAGFRPTADQPYRRLRRHTLTTLQKS